MPFSDGTVTGLNGIGIGRTVLLPPYIQRTLSEALPGLSEAELADFADTPLEYLRVSHIGSLRDGRRKLQYAYLLLARHVFTQKLKGVGSRQKRMNGVASAESGTKFEEVIPKYGAGVKKVEEEDEDDGNWEGIALELVLERAKVYEALGYADLALADAYVAYTLLLVAQGGEVDTDLVPVGMDGQKWVPSREDEDDEEEEEEEDREEQSGEDANRHEQRHRYGRRNDNVSMSWAEDIPDMVFHALLILCRSALLLGCESQAKTWYDELVRYRSELPRDKSNWANLFSELQIKTEQQQMRFAQAKLAQGFWCIFPIDMEGLSKRVQKLVSISDAENGATCTTTSSGLPLFGWSLREVYPWSEHEPERMSQEALEDINARLAKVAPSLEVKTTLLPALAATGEEVTDATGKEKWAQLGLYAKEDLVPGSKILEERSMLTGIRPHGEALCDACAADMEAIPSDERRYCEGCNIPFCSDECLSAATASYHVPNAQDDETDKGYPPSESPFCPGTVAFDDLHTLGRAESSTTPEYDLYFLLLSRTLQLAETQQIHPLDLFEIKYLWGDFLPTRDANVLDSGRQTKHTLPFSVRHHVELPLQWFEILMHSRRECRPYSAAWLEKYDWWIVQTLFAKFRGVADAQQSTWTGKPEVAAVHPLWCLANHSCNPNVTWSPSGVRNLTVMKGRAWSTTSGYARGGAESTWDGIKKGEEIWNHYTDVHEKDYRERRGRLQAVLGGDCRCERCTYEAEGGSLVN